MADKPTYRVRNWEKHFECSSTRKIVGALKWVPIPTKHDGATFRRLMRRDDGFTVYACWVLLLQVAAKCSTRGVLAGDHGPIDADDLAIMTDVPAEHFRGALDVLSSAEIGWLEIAQTNIRHDPPRSATIAADSGATEPPSATIAVYRKEGRKERKKETEIASLTTSKQALAQQLANMSLRVSAENESDAGMTIDAKGGAQ